MQCGLIQAGGRLRAAVLLCAVLVFNASLCRAQAGVGTGKEAASLHLLAGAAASLAVSAAAYPLVDSRTAGARRTDALLVAGLGLSGAVVAGLAKEILDMSGFGEPDWRDFLLTVGGGLLASSFVYAVGCAQEAAAGGRTPGLAVVYGSFAFLLALPVGENLLKRVTLSSESRS